MLALRYSNYLWIWVLEFKFNILQLLLGFRSLYLIRWWKCLCVYWMSCLHSPYLRKVRKIVSFDCHIHITNTLFIAHESSGSVIKIRDIMIGFASVHWLLFTHFTFNVLHKYKITVLSYSDWFSINGDNLCYHRCEFMFSENKMDPTSNRSCTHSTPQSDCNIM